MPTPEDNERLGWRDPIQLRRHSSGWRQGPEPTIRYGYEFCATCWSKGFVISRGVKHTCWGCDGSGRTLVILD